eukprot:TRINITY_DN18146_c0_g1_i1.p1 TRINITY_DN18146_c0_g1~~TRINITY_DN18146_c0_g1_i1.p1  ORF type:complete len:280 (-),score=63.65 TRINITY_DN18146_c0_g1_i1:104-943(-)
MSYSFASNHDYPFTQSTPTATSSTQTKQYAPSLLTGGFTTSYNPSTNYQAPNIQTQLFPSGAERSGWPSTGQPDVAYSYGLFPQSSQMGSDKNNYVPPHAPISQSYEPPAAQLYDDRSSMMQIEPMNINTQTNNKQLGFPLPLRTEKSSAYDDTWVTVYGFSPSDLSLVLNQLHKYGDLVNHIVPNYGNWVHVQFRTSNQALSVISKGGKLLLGSSRLMIGIVPVVFGNDGQPLGVSAQTVRDYPQNVSSSVPVSSATLPPVQVQPSKLGKIFEMLFGW